MKIAMITPWNVTCGIYTYSKALTKAIAELDTEVYIIRLPRFGRKTPEILQNVVDSIPLDKVDLIHVQHEYGLYTGLEGGFYGALKPLNKPVVTTMHATGNWETDRVIGSTSDRMIVHNEYCKRRLGHPEAIIIPHGTELCKTVPAEEAKKAYNIQPKAPTVGYFGFISVYKGVEHLIDAMVKVPKAAALIAGGHIGPATTYYINLKEMSLKLLPNRCQWIGTIPDDKRATAFGAMDIMVYPARFTTESGALLTVLGYGKAVITSKLPPFREKEKLGAVMTYSSINNLARKIKRLLKDNELRLKLEEGAHRYAETVSWAKVAQMHVDLYRELTE